MNETAINPDLIAQEMWCSNWPAEIVLDVLFEKYQKLCNVQTNCCSQSWQLFQLAAAACHVTVATTETTVKETVQGANLISFPFPELYLSSANGSMKTNSSETISASKCHYLSWDKTNNVQRIIELLNMSWWLLLTLGCIIKSIQKVWWSYRLLLKCI